MDSYHDREILKASDLCIKSSASLISNYHIEYIIHFYGDVVLLQRLRQGQAEHVFDFAVQQAGTVQLAENAQHAARPVHVFHMVFLGTWRHW